jgi:hypothetical protein
VPRERDRRDSHVNFTQKQERAFIAPHTEIQRNQTSALANAGEAQEEAMMEPLVRPACPHSSGLGHGRRTRA